MSSTLRKGEDWIDNTAIREAALEAVARGLTWTEIAHRMGWTRRAGGSETSQVKRRLGVMDDVSGHHKTPIRTRTIRYDLAVRICRAIERDPFELDL